MKPVLVVGLGNGLVGDDGVGCRLIERLTRDRALRRRADFAVGATDLLRLADCFTGRRAVVLIDAVLSDEEPGTVRVYEEPFEELDTEWSDAHAPSLVQSVGLLKMLSPALRGTPFWLIGVAVPELRHDAILSPRLPEIAARVRAALARRITARASSPS